MSGIHKNNDIMIRSYDEHSFNTRRATRREFSFVTAPKRSYYTGIVPVIRSRTSSLLYIIIKKHTPCGTITLLFFFFLQI